MNDYIKTVARPVESIEKPGDPTKYWGFKGCKDMKDVFAVTLRRFSGPNLEQERQLALMLQQQYKRFHPDKKVEVEVEQWKGESSLEIIKGLDSITIVTFQRPAKDEEPKEVRTEVSKVELQAMVDSILKLKDSQPIKTEALSMVFSQTLNLGHDGWNTGNKQFFSDRHWHNKYTRILQAFQEMDLVEYKKGKTKLLDKNISVQTILN